MLGTYLGKPIVGDDTVNFVPFKTSEEAENLVKVLNSNPALSFYRAMTFIDAKRPYTVDLLKQLDVEKLMGRQTSHPVLPLFRD
jgi:hypothetical protein